MAEPSVEQLFLEFRRTGAPGPLAAVFDVTAPELLALARSELGHPQDAEDAVQSTFLTALQKAESFDAGARLVPWLVGILKRHCRRIHRPRASLDLDRLRRAAAAAPADALRADEVALAVRDAVRQLPQPYRTALALRLLHGLTARQIAESLGMPAGAVRVRLHRGLRMLRALLPAGLAGCFAALFPAAGLAAVRAQLCAGAATPPSPASTTVLALMTTKNGMLAAGVALLLGGLLLWTRGPAPAPPAVDHGALSAREVMRVPPAQSEDAGVERTALADGPAPAVAAPQDEAGAGARGALRVVVVAAGAPAEGVAVRVLPEGEGDAWGIGREACTDASGTVVLDAFVPGRYAVHLDRRVDVTAGAAGTPTVSPARDWLAARVEVVAGRTVDVPLQVTGDLTVRGVVVDPSGAPVAGATVWCAPFTAPPHASQPIATTDAAGAFRAAAVGGEHWISARAPGFAPSRAFSPWRASHGAEGFRDLRLPLRAPGGAVRGRVVDERHRPVAGAAVLVGPGLFDAGHETVAGGIWAENAPPALVRTGPDGRFALDSVPSGVLAVRARAAAHPAVEAEVEVAPGATAEAEIVLARGWTLEGHVRDRAGRPVAGADVVVRAAPAGGDAAAGSGAPVGVATTDAEGRYRVPGLGAGSVDVEARAPDHVPATVRARGARGETVALDVALAREALLRGRVRSADGLPFADCAIAAQRTDGAGEPVGARCDADGRFALAADAAAHYALRLRLPEGAWTDCSWLGAVPGDSADLEIVVTPGLVTFAVVRGTLRDAAGAPFDGGVRAWRDDDTRAGWTAVDADGGFVLGPLAAGRVRLVAEPRRPDQPAFVVLVSTRLEGGEVDLGEVRAPGGGTLAVQVTAADAQAIHGYVRDARDGTIVLQMTADVQGRAEARLAAGDYTVEVFALRTAGAATRPQSRDVRIVSGQTSTLRLALP